MYTLANLVIGNTDPSFQGLEIERQTIVVDTAFFLSWQREVYTLATLGIGGTDPSHQRLEISDGLL